MVHPLSILPLFDATDYPVKYDPTLADTFFMYVIGLIFICIFGGAYEALYFFEKYGKADKEAEELRKINLQTQFDSLKNQLSFIKTKASQKFIVDYALDDIEAQLDPSLFFRLNRKIITHVTSIESVHPYFNSKLKIHLKPATEEEVLVSREKSSEFKAWMGA